MVNIWHSLYDSEFNKPIIAGLTLVNLNQLGEAAGVTAYLALHQGKAIRDVGPKEVRTQLSNAGSIII